MALMCICCFLFVKQKTAYEMRISDWSSDVCSSDLQSGQADDPGAWGYGIAASCCNVDPVDERQGAEQCGTDDRREEPPRRCQHPALQGCCRTGGLGLQPVAGRDRKSTRLNSSH